ncbi:MAG: mechanosensitive ion channel [Clostridiaceae bacterium]|nr:mechanosensitive ion channel [Clostridiaceae bacterium]
MESLISNLTTMATATGGKIVLAILVLIIGNILIKSLMKFLGKSKLMDKIEGTVRTFVLSFIKAGLYVILVISIIGILGVPMASVIAVLASAGVAVGLALQGALSNLAGGIMLMIFKPFHQGDYIAAAGVEGVVNEVTLFYTVILTLDNKRITVPNGSLMNANVTDFSSEPLRRVDLGFACAKSEAPAKIQDMMIAVMKANPKVLADPEPFARISGGTNEAMAFTVRAWCKNEDYWDVYFDLTQKITEAMAENHVQAPAVRVTTDAQK